MVIGAGLGLALDRSIQKVLKCAQPPQQATPLRGVADVLAVGYDNPKCGQVVTIPHEANNLRKGETTHDLDNVD